MPTTEQRKFFVILSIHVSRGDDMRHEQLSGHLAGDNFTAQEATEYMAVSMSTFRRLVSSGKLKPSLTVERNQLFAVAGLKVYKKALKVSNV